MGRAKGTPFFHEVRPAEGGVDGLLIDSAIAHDGHPECRVQGGALCRFAIRWA